MRAFSAIMCEQKSLSLMKPFENEFARATTEKRTASMRSAVASALEPMPTLRFSTRPGTDRHLPAAGATLGRCTYCKRRASRERRRVQEGVTPGRAVRAPVKP
jgi:hypothetical protein